MAGIFAPKNTPQIIEHTYAKETEITQKMCPFLHKNCVGSLCAVWVPLEIQNYDQPAPFDGRCGAICIREDE